MPTTISSNDNAWPPLAYADWANTCNTLHLWTQVVGKVKLALAPLANHWWGIVLTVTARGLTTGPMPYRGRAVQIDFDFCGHELIVRTSDAREQRLALKPMTVADFYAAVMAALAALDVEVRIWTMPVEIVDAIPFEQDRTHASYDAAAAQVRHHGRHGPAGGRPRVQRLPRALPRQGEPGAFLLGIVRSRGDALHRTPRAAAYREQGSRRRSLGDAGSL